MMGTLDALRTWRDRNPETTPDDWRVAQGQGWKPDTFYGDAADRGTIPREVAETYAANEARSHRLDNADQVAHMTRPDGPARNLFIEKRPRGDSLVYVLLRELTALNAEAGRLGHEWYERNRATLTVDRGSDFITRIRSKIAEFRNQPQPVDAPPRNVWAEWRTLAAELVKLGGRHGARFAVDTEDGAVNKIAFWWISPSEGPQGTRYFLRQVIGGQGPVRVRMSPDAMVSVARKIMAAGAEDALRRYGRELGECGHCGRELTNDVSRSLGIGPVCRNKGQ
jgi:hypothetical protein